MTRLLITGATGFLGSHAARAFTDMGFDVVATGRDARRGIDLEAIGIRFVPAELTAPRTLRGLCSDVDVVIHCAALSTAWAHPPARFHSVNVEGTLNLISAARQAGVGRFVHVSTPAVLSRFEHQFGLTEDHPLPDKYTSLYGETKAEAERLVLECTDFETAVIRPKAIYGPGDRALLPRLIEAAQRGRLPIIGSGQTITDITHVDDVVAALHLAAIARKVTGIYHIAGPEPVNLWEMLDQLLPLLGYPSPSRRLSTERAMEIGRWMEKTWTALHLKSEPPLTRYKAAVLAYSQTLDISKARSELRYAPSMSLDAGLETILGAHRSEAESGESQVRQLVVDTQPGKPIEVEVRNTAIVRPPGLLLGKPTIRRIPLPVLTAHIKHPEHGNIWFDTGYPTGKAKGRRTVFQVLYDWMLAPQIENLTENREPGTVIISHGDPDHIGGLHRFPNAEVFMAAETWDELMNPRAPWRSRVLLPPDLNRRVHLLDVASGEIDLFDDGTVSIMRLPGHAPGHIGLRVAGEKTFLMCGDAALNRSSIITGRLGPFHLIADKRSHAQETLVNLLGHLGTASTTVVPSHCADAAMELIGPHWIDQPDGSRERRRTRDETADVARALFIVVPVYNERDLVTQCLDSLACQTDPDFTLLAVDNGSTDGSAEVIAHWIERHPEIQADLLHEPRKGTGAAADTGFRSAIERGADWIARTDADCLVAEDWVETIRRGSGNADMLGGKIKVRRDEASLPRLTRLMLPASIRAARLYGRLRPSNRGRDFRCGYVMCAGNNLAIRATTYEEAGGFPRLAIEELPIPNDRAVVNRVRQVSDSVRYLPDMIVFNSTRRLRSYGLTRTLRWYAKHNLNTERFSVDVR